MAWSAAQYLKFAEDRTRAARDLLAAVPADTPGHVVDLGCGPGNSTALLVGRFPGAAVTGIDTDPDMLATARKALPYVRFEQADITGWSPQRPVDLLFANASLQWVDDHEALFPRLLGYLAPGGSLAVQMPDNLNEPTHRAMREIAQAPEWRDRLQDTRANRKPLIPPHALYALLRPTCSRVDVWRTVYHFELEGVAGIVEWFKGSALPPYLAPLDPDEQARFLSEFHDAITPHYPETDGRSLLAFPRYFFVATL